MKLTPQHLEIASGAYFAGLNGHGIVVADHAYPAAHDLAEQGWLERYFRGDELYWRWTRTADAALALSGLMRGAEGRDN